MKLVIVYKDDYNEDSRKATLGMLNSIKENLEKNIEADMGSVSIKKVDVIYNDFLLLLTEEKLELLREILFNYIEVERDDINESRVTDSTKSINEREESLSMVASLQTALDEVGD